MQLLIFVIIFPAKEKVVSTSIILPGLTINNFRIDVKFFSNGFYANVSFSGKITHDLMQTSSELQKANDYIAELRAHSCPPKPQSAPSRGSWNKSQPIPVSDCSSRQVR